MGGVPTLNAASASYYFLDRDNQPTNQLVRPSDLARMMDEGQADGMTMVCSNTYPKLEDGASAEWKSISDLPELKAVLMMLSSNDESAPPKTVAEEDMVFEDDPALNKKSGGDVKDELASFLEDTDKMGGAEEQSAPTKAEAAEEDEDDSYESDGGTTYVKEPLSGVWVDENDLPPQVRAMRRKKRAAREKKEKAEVRGCEGRFHRYFNLTRPSLRRHRKPPPPLQTATTNKRGNATRRPITGFM